MFNFLILQKFNFITPEPDQGVFWHPNLFCHHGSTSPHRLGNMLCHVAPDIFHREENICFHRACLFLDYNDGYNRLELRNMRIHEVLYI